MLCRLGLRRHKIGCSFFPDPKPGSGLDASEPKDAGIECLGRLHCLVMDHRVLRLVSIALLGIFMQGCTTPKGSVGFEVAANRYEETLDVVRGTLRDARFEVDRVDAGAGVVSTYPKSTAGLATPWDGEQMTLGEEVSDLVNQQERVVRVSFASDDGDLRSGEGTLRAQVEVIVYRVRRGGWRVETESISRSTHARDPLAAKRGHPWRFSQAIRRDDAFAAVLADRMRDRLGLEAEDE